MKLISSECHAISLMRNQHCLANVDPNVCRHVVSIGHNELSHRHGPNKFNSLVRSKLYYTKRQRKSHTYDMTRIHFSHYWTFARHQSVSSRSPSPRVNIASFDVPRGLVITSCRTNNWILGDSTHWGRVTHICVSELTIIGLDNGLSPGRHQAIIWNNDGLLLIEPLGTNVSEISIGIQTFSSKRMHLNMSSAKWRPFCLGLNVLRRHAAHLTHWPLGDSNLILSS